MHFVAHICLTIFTAFGINHSNAHHTKVKAKEKSHVEYKAEQKAPEKAPSYESPAPAYESNAPSYETKAPAYETKAPSSVIVNEKAYVGVGSNPTAKAPAAPSYEAPATAGYQSSQGLSLGVEVKGTVKYETSKKEEKQEKKPAGCNQ